MTKEQLQAQLNMLLPQVQQIRDDANFRVGMVDGQIQLLKKLIAEFDSSPVEAEKSAEISS